jgi:hypothetical protein
VLSTFYNEISRAIPVVHCYDSTGRVRSEMLLDNKWWSVNAAVAGEIYPLSKSARGGIVCAK